MAIMGKQKRLASSLAKALILSPAGILGVGVSVIPILFSITAGIKGQAGSFKFPLPPSEVVSVLWESFWVPSSSAALAVLLAFPLNITSFFFARWRKPIFSLTLVILFSNPIFFVFVWAVLWPWERGLAAVISASTFILYPVAAVVIGSGLRSLSHSVVQVGRLSGATVGLVLRDIVVPWVLPEIILSWLLCFIFALGFYLVPLYVGGARIRSVTVLVDRSLNQVGDVATAGFCLLLVVTLAIAGTVLAAVSYLTFRYCLKGRWI